MPHYVIELDDRRGQPDTFAIYSTIVDGLLTEPMSADEMEQYLKANGYDSHLTETTVESIAKAHNDLGLDIDTGPNSWAQSVENYSYWNGKFSYGKLSQPYFCLPRRHWRNGR